MLSAMRRAIDFTAALIVLVVLSPLLAVIAIAVALDSPGPAFYRAPRAGKDGRVFRMWKFRTMVMNAAQSGSSITGHNDPRITRLGGFLRRSKLDELPQFLNVLSGEMSLVGPRPEDPAITALYTAEQLEILTVKPGITGKGQLESADESAAIPEGVKADEFYVQHILERKLQSDLHYIQNRTASQDARIVVETAAYVLRALVRRS